MYLTVILRPVPQKMGKEKEWLKFRENPIDLIQGKNFQTTLNDIKERLVF